MRANLERSLGLPAVMAIAISAMIGSGIFVLPGLAVALTGRSAWLAYVVAAICVLPAALSKAELATAMPASGGSFVYLDRAFGPWAGTVAGLSLWASMWLKATFALLGFSAYLAVLTPVGPDGAKAAALVSLLGVGALNILGAKKVGRAQLVVVAVGISGLGLAVGAALGGGTERVAPTPLLSDGLGGLLAATGLVFVSFNGVTKVAAVAEEVKTPHRTLPRGILASLGLVTLIYATVTYAMTEVLSTEALATDLRPVHSLVEAVAGDGPLALGAGLLGVVTMTAMANAGLLAASRFPFAMSRARLLPPVFAHLSSRWHTPTVGISTTVVVMAVAILFFDVAALAKLASGTVMLIFIAVMSATILLRESRATWYAPGFRAPFYPWLQLFGIASGLALLWQLGATALVALLATVLPGSLLYFAYGRRRAGRRGVLGKVGRRRDLPPRPTEVTAEPAHAEPAHAEVVVALFGGERSPEMVAEVGLALAEGGHVLATHFREREPDAVVVEESRRLDSLGRRLVATGERHQASLEVSAVESRDLVSTIHAMSHRLHNRWVVVEEDAGAGRIFPRLSRLGWSINQLGANLAVFRDRGVRYPKRILVVPRPGPHDALSVTAAADLSASWDAEITLLAVVDAQASEDEAAARRAYLEQLRRLVSQPVQVEVLRGDVIARVSEESVSHDLVVLGAPELSLRSLLRGSLEDRIADRVACSVVTVRTPRGETHAVVDRHDEAPPDALDFVSPEVVVAKLPLETREGLFSEMSERFAAALDHHGGPVVAAQSIEAAFAEREREQSTMVADGVALPHASIDGIERTLLGVFTLATPLPFESGSAPVEVVFATIGPPTARFDHLRVLRAVARLTLHPASLAAIVEAEDGHAIYAALEGCSSPVASPGRASYDARP